MRAARQARGSRQGSCIVRCIIHHSKLSVLVYLGLITAHAAVPCLGPYLCDSVECVGDPCEVVQHGLGLAPRGIIVGTNMAHPPMNLGLR